MVGCSRKPSSVDPCQAEGGAVEGRGLQLQCGLPHCLSRARQGPGLFSFTWRSRELAAWAGLGGRYESGAFVTFLILTLSLP